MHLHNGPDYPNGDNGQDYVVAVIDGPDHYWSSSNDCGLMPRTRAIAKTVLAGGFVWPSSQPATVCAVRPTATARASRLSPATPRAARNRVPLNSDTKNSQDRRKGIWPPSFPPGIDPDLTPVIGVGPTVVPGGVVAGRPSRVALGVVTWGSLPPWGRNHPTTGVRLAPSPAKPGWGRTPVMCGGMAARSQFPPGPSLPAIPQPRFLVGFSLSPGQSGPCGYVVLGLSGRLGGH